MKLDIRLLVLWVALLVSSVKDANGRTCNFGTEFVIGVPSRYTGRNTIMLGVTAPAPAHVLVSVPGLRRVLNYTVNGSYIMNLTDWNFHKGTGTYITHLGIHVLADNDVAITVSNGETWSAESYLALPVNQLGTDYVATSYVGGNGGLPFAVITAVYNDTDVTLSLPGKSINHTITINDLDVYQYQPSTNVDLTGAVVVCSKPCAVVSGSSCSNIPTNATDCGSLFEQLLPISTWGHKYIVPSITGNPYYVVRVLAMHSNVDIDLYYRQTFPKHISSLHSEMDLGFLDSPVLIESHNRIGTFLYGVTLHNSNPDISSGFLVLIPSMEQYSNTYEFTLYTLKDATNGNSTNHVAVMVQSNKTDGIRFDNNILPFDVTRSSQSVADYTVLTIDTTEGYHTLTHVESSVKFGAIVYGLGHLLGYGLPAGLNPQGDNCTVSSSSTFTPSIPGTYTMDTVPIVTSPKTRTATTVGVVEPTSKATPTPTGVHSNVSCFACDDMSHLEYCDVITRCSENQVCYVEKYGTPHSHVHIYRSGCLDRTICFNYGGPISITSGHEDRCVQCCHGNYCNNQGCGDNAFPSRDQRGPLCLACQHVGHPSECQTAALCDRNEVCSIEEFNWGDHSHFKLGCAYTTVSVGGLCTSYF